MRHISGVSNAIWSGMFIESPRMQYGRANRGMIGVTLQTKTLEILGLSQQSA